MKKNHISFLLFQACLIISNVIGQSTNIVIDENFSDWTSDLATYEDGEQNPDQLDLLSYQVTNNDKYLFVKFTVNKEICVPNQYIPHGIMLGIDADDDPNTGFPEQQYYGLELTVDFSGYSNDEKAYAWFTPIGQSATKVSLMQLGLQLLPSVSSNTFELAIPRDIQPDGTHSLFTSNSIRVMLKDELYGDRMPDDGTVFSYTFDESTIAQYEPIGIQKENHSFIRLVNYNTMHNNGWDDDMLIDLEAIVKAVNGDIYCFTEAGSTEVNTIKTLMDGWLPQGNPDGWFIYKSYKMLTASRWPIIQDTALEKKQPTLIDLPGQYPNDLWVINAHLAYGNADPDRQRQADEFVAFIRDHVKQQSTPADVPFMLLGDLNLIGINQPRKTLIEGDIQDTINFGHGIALDWDDTELADAIPFNANGTPFAYTWRHLNTNKKTFPPGRLDYQIYTDAILTKEKAFVLQTEMMNPDTLLLYNLNSTTTRMSDHLPVVVDYFFVQSSGKEPIEDFQGSMPGFYPNPANDIICLNQINPIENLTILDMNGRVMMNFQNPLDQLNISSLPSGIYTITIQSGIQVNQMKMVKY